MSRGAPDKGGVRQPGSRFLSSRGWQVRMGVATGPVPDNTRMMSSVLLMLAEGESKL